ncbi:hypothetical protein DPMN_137733 [Dreissena polymorpha]|uniref:Myb/SANT-like DNA-binding domain-containing protein n=1 Tax=Dreissena polymorpha TaxID=45954 RepID=A0A9D4G6B3_DREPO|nr:hypothetical protein DPMN_137733 [Dreissena polymorpha]
MADNSDSTVFSSGWKCLNLTFEDGSTSTASVEAIVYRSIITDKDPQAIQRLQEVWTEIHGNQTIVQIAAEENENQQCNIADTESQEETSDTEMPVVDESKDGINWKHEGVLLLISLYEAHKEKFASSAFSKKAVWNMIATKMKDQGYSVTGHQCSEKFKSLKNRYKDNRKKMAKSGRGRVTWRYYDIMEELLAGDPAVEPLKVVASANCAKDPAAKPPLPPNAKRPQISSPSANAVAIRAAI